MSGTFRHSNLTMEVGNSTSKALANFEQNTQPVKGQGRHVFRHKLSNNGFFPRPTAHLHEHINNLWPPPFLRGTAHLQVLGTEAKHFVTPIKNSIKLFGYQKGISSLTLFALFCLQIQTQFCPIVFEEEKHLFWRRK